MKYNICPSCKKRISWKARWRFTNGIILSFRRPAPCPHCGTMLVWSKWPWRISYSGAIFILIKGTKQIRAKLGHKRKPMNKSVLQVKYPQNA